MHRRAAGAGLVDPCDDPLGVEFGGALKNIIAISQEVSGEPASSKPFELSRYYDPSYREAK